MAPTGVLARQYADKTGPLLSQAGMSWALLTGATPAAERERIHEQLQSGELDVLFGTHAVLSDNVTFKHLSLVVIDEQHRFGVGQRSGPTREGPRCRSACYDGNAIPRTLALSVYGDLDTSIIRHRPVPGAGVTTRVLTESSRDLAYGAIREAHEKGQQAYVICPLVEPSDSADELEDVPGIARDDEGRVTVPVQLHDTANRARPPAAWRCRACIERLHGRMPAGEKDRVIDAFKRGEIDVLVSTTVVEVGVDVPNATVMVIENGERFGLLPCTSCAVAWAAAACRAPAWLLTHSKGNGGSHRRHKTVYVARKDLGMLYARSDGPASAPRGRNPGVPSAWRCDPALCGLGRR